MLLLPRDKPRHATVLDAADSGMSFQNLDADEDWLTHDPKFEWTEDDLEQQRRLEEMELLAMVGWWEMEGVRKWTDRHLIRQALQFVQPSLVIQGEARGADSLARDVAQNLGIEVLPFPANWEKYGRAAGPIRNKQMLDEGDPDGVLAFPSHDRTQAYEVTY